MLLAKFMVFQIVLVTADIVTDILTGITLLKQPRFRRNPKNDKDEYLYVNEYGWATIAIIFAPFLVRVILTMASFGRCFQWSSSRLTFDQRRFSMWKHELGNFIWDFPLLQPIRFKSSFYHKIFKLIHSNSKNREAKF